MHDRAENSARLATRIVADLDQTHPEDSTRTLLDLVQLMTPASLDQLTPEQDTWWSILRTRCHSKRDRISLATMRRVEKILIARL